MHIGEEHRCPGTGNAIYLLGEGIEIVEVADDKGRQHDVGSGVTNW